MKHFFRLSTLFIASSIIALSASLPAYASRHDAHSKAARGVIARTLGHYPKNLVIEVTGPVSEGEYFSTEAKNGKLIVKGSSVTAACRGFYDYVTSGHYGMFTWTINNIQLPKAFPDSPLKIVTTPFEHRQYMNVCTFGYTMPYWGWEQWERELDWMALHGIDMPLSPIGSEAIFARVWRSLGLTEEEIGDFMAGAAHLPWFRMGNMSGIDGHPSQEWYDKTIALEHKIIDRMNELGMSPVYNAFAGFVPKGLKRVFPDVELVETGWADGPDYFSSFIFPETELYQRIAKEYIKEWEKEFGKGKYYLADSFNEMKVPFAERGTQERFDQIASYGQALYNSISSANPDAIWVLQGWMFGYQRHIWDPESIRALFSKVPDDRMLLLDLSVDFNYGIWENEYTWNYAKGIYGKKWIYSTVPNFGGRTCPVGDLDFYLNGHLNALTSPNKGNLIGLGTAPEGVENNEVIYEIIADAAWSTSHKDIREWLRNYTVNRYGSCPDAIMEFWDKMLASDYGFCSSRAQYRVQKKPFDGLGGRYSVSKTHFEALEAFVAASDELGNDSAYLTDLALWAGIYAFGKADVLAQQIHRAYLVGDKDTASNSRQAHRHGDRVPKWSQVSWHLSHICRFPPNPYVAEAKALVAAAHEFEINSDELPGWTSFDMTDGSTRVIRMITPEDYPLLKGLRFTWRRGEDPVKLKLVQINAAGWVRFKKDDIGIEISRENPVVEIPVDLKVKNGETFQFNYLHIVLDETKKMTDSQVTIEYVK